MTTEIIELDPLVPSEIEFRYQSKSYVLPGDISVDMTFRLQKLMMELAKAEVEAAGSENGAFDEQKKLTLEVENVLLELFKEKNPELDSLPFGAVGFRIVLATILMKLGFGEVEVPDPPRGPTTRKKMKAPAPTSKSRRSSTSRSS